MQDSPFKKFIPGYPPAYPNSNTTSNPGTAATSAPLPGVDELARIFNTAMVATRSQENRDFQTELYTLMESPPFRAILTAIRQHARLQGVSEKTAAEQVIRTFRKLDDLWNSYVFQEGVEQIGGGNGG